MLQHSRAKIIWHRQQSITAEYGIAHLPAKHDARRLNVVVDAGPNPQDEEKTRGVKEAISVSLTDHIVSSSFARADGTQRLWIELSLSVRVD